MTHKRAEFLTGYEIRRIRTTNGSARYGAYQAEELVAQAQHEVEAIALRRLVTRVLALHCREVLDDYGWRCAYCRRSRPLEFHHKTPRSLGGTHRKENLEPVCWDCHRAIHSRPRGWRKGGA